MHLASRGVLQFDGWSMAYIKGSFISILLWWVDFHARRLVKGLFFLNLKCSLLLSRSLNRLPGSSAENHRGLSVCLHSHHEEVCQDTKAILNYRGRKPLPEILLLLISSQVNSGLDVQFSLLAVVGLVMGSRLVNRSPNPFLCLMMH